MLEGVGKTVKMDFKCTQVFNVFFEPYHLFYWGTARVNFSFVFCSYLPTFFSDLNLSQIQTTRLFLF